MLTYVHGIYKSRQVLDQLGYTTAVVVRCDRCEASRVSDRKVAIFRLLSAASQFLCIISILFCLFLTFSIFYCVFSISFFLVLSCSVLFGLLFTMTTQYDNTFTRSCLCVIVCVYVCVYIHICMRIRMYMCDLRSLLLLLLSFLNSHAHGLTFVLSLPLVTHSVQPYSVQPYDSNFPFFISFILQTLRVKDKARVEAGSAVGKKRRKRKKVVWHHRIDEPDKKALSKLNTHSKYSLLSSSFQRQKQGRTRPALRPLDH